MHLFTLFIKIKFIKLILSTVSGWWLVGVTVTLFPKKIVDFGYPPP